MPYKIRKNRNKNTYRLVNIKTGQVKEYSTTRKKATRQLRLLNAIEHGFKPSQSYIRKKSRKTRKRKIN